MTVAMDDEAVANYFDQQVDQGHQPEQFMRVWLHTHPGESAQPSGTDEETFERVFGQCDWAVMAILARGGQSYARLRFGVGPGGQMLIPVEMDFSGAFPAADHEAWQAEYNLHVTAESEFRVMHPIAGALLNADGEEDLAQLHHRRLHRWHEQDSWDMQDLNELADELQRQAILEDMEVALDSR